MTTRLGSLLVSSGLREYGDSVANTMNVRKAQALMDSIRCVCITIIGYRHERRETGEVSPFSTESLTA